MKKFLALVLAVLMIASTVVTVAAFDDVAADNKYAAAINELQEYGVVAGKTATQFAPDELVTRWQMALFMARATSGETNDAAWNVGASLFTDCTQYLGAIQYCYTKGIIKGVTTTEFAPNNNITLRDGVIMAVRALNYEKEDEYVEASAKKYTVTGANYWLPYWQKADEIGMLENLKDLSVTAELTRAQTAQLICNMLNSVVYNYDANGYKYTLEEVVFGGKQIVNVDNVTGAWIIAVPGQTIDEDEIDEDDEYVLVQVNDKKNPEIIEIPFEDLKEAGVDVEKIGEYFGAYIELVNCRRDNTDRDDDQEINYIYKEYEYLAGVELDNKLVGTDADVVYHDKEDRIRVNGKTHYFDDEERNYIAVYEIVDGAWELIDGDVNAALENKFYDVTFIDVDVDGYYEVALVNFYNIDTYKANKASGKVNCGVMAGEKDVEFSEKLSVDEIFVYTYNPFTKYVDVKGVIEAGEGTITGRKSSTEDGITTTELKIDGEKFVLEYADGDKFVNAFEEVGTVKVTEDINLKTVEVADVVDTAKANMGKTVELFFYNEQLIAIGEEVDEVESYDYLIVNDFTDFELYEYVVFDAVVDGAEDSIKVKKIYEMDGTKKKELYDYTELSYSKLSKALELDKIFGIYSYKVDDDGFYTLTKKDLTLDLSEYVKLDDGVITFSGWEIPSTERAIKDATERQNILRVTSDTIIYLINETDDDKSVEMITPSSHFTIKVGTDNVQFMTDRIGYGDTDEYQNEADGIKFGKASYLFIRANSEYVDYSEYKFAYVGETLASVEFGNADEFELETGLEDTWYGKYTAENGEAYLAANFDEVEEIYVEDGDEDLKPGMYLLNSDNIVVDSLEVEDFEDGENLLGDDVELPFYVWDVAADDIALYDYDYITIAGHDEIGNKVKTIRFRVYTEEDGEVMYQDYSNDKLIDYLEENYVDKTTDPVTYTDAKIVIMPNVFTGFDKNFSFADNTINAIVVG